MFTNKLKSLRHFVYFLYILLFIDTFTTNFPYIKFTLQNTFIIITIAYNLVTIIYFV